MADYAPGEAWKRVHAWATELGFAAAGAAPATPAGPRERDALLAWLGDGKHGEMEYLGREPEKRLDPDAVLPSARSAVMVLDAYGSRQDGDDAALPDGAGRIARYARGRDYHTHLKKRLFKLADRIEAELSPPVPEGAERGVRVFVDTAPVLERDLAARAGLGAIGKHTLLIHPRLGSWFFIGGVLTTLDLTDEGSRPVPDLCGACTKCIDACPTGAIEPYSVDARRCISYLTIEHRSEIDPGFDGAMRDAGYVFGCDICQEVCPHNRPVPEGSSREAGLAPVESGYEPFVDAPDRVAGGTAFDLQKVLGWSEDDRRAAFERSAMKRAKLDMFKRNASIVLGRSGEGDGVDVDHA